MFLVGLIYLLFCFLSKEKLMLIQIAVHLLHFYYNDFFVESNDFLLELNRKGLTSFFHDNPFLLKKLSNFSHALSEVFANHCVNLCSNKAVKTTAIIITSIDHHPIHAIPKKIQKNQSANSIIQSSYYFFMRQRNMQFLTEHVKKGKILSKNNYFSLFLLHFLRYKTNKRGLP